MPGKKKKKCFIYFSYGKLFGLYFSSISNHHHKTDCYISVWISNEASHCCKKLKSEEWQTERREAPAFPVHAEKIHRSCPAMVFTIRVHKDKTKITQRPSLNWSPQPLRSKFGRKWKKLLLTGISSGPQNLDKQHEGHAYKRTQRDLYFETSP